MGDFRLHRFVVCCFGAPARPKSSAIRQAIDISPQRDAQGRNGLQRALLSGNDRLIKKALKGIHTQEGLLERDASGKRALEYAIEADRGDWLTAIVKHSQRLAKTTGQLVNVLAAVDRLGQTPWETALFRSPALISFRRLRAKDKYVPPPQPTALAALKALGADRCQGVLAEDRFISTVPDDFTAQLRAEMRARTGWPV